MPNIRRQFVDGPYGQVHIRIASPAGTSRKPPLICLHQSPKSGREFIPFMEIAGSDRIIVAVDSPGHGESDVPVSIDLATIPNYASSALAVVKELGLQRVDLLGNHTGSSVAVEMTAQAPQTINNIALISCPIYTHEEIENFKQLFTPVPLDEKGSRFLDGWEKGITYRGPGVSLEDLALSYAENYRAGEAYEWGHHAAFENSAGFPERLKSLKHKITVINPGDLIFDATLRSKPYLTNGTIINYPEWGIGFLGAYPEDAAREILKALD